MSLSSTERHLKNLVEIPSVSGNEAEALGYVEDVLEHLGHVSVIHSSEYGVIGRIDGRRRGKAVMLQGHVDTVEPAEGWDTDPFKLKITDEYLIGLGASDMKGGCAQMLATAERQTDPDATQIYQFVLKEETGGQGTDGLFDVNTGLAEEFPLLGCLLLEPTNAAFFGISHRAALQCDVTVDGVAGHGAQNLAGKVTALDRLHELRQGLMSAQEGEWAQEFSSTEYGSPTANMTGPLETGPVSNNQVPSRINTKLDIRYTPEMKPHLPDIISDLSSRYGLLIQYDADSELPDPVRCPPDAYIRRLLRQLYPDIIQTSFMGTTDMNGLQEAGWPTVISGPGDPREMHVADERTLRRSVVAHQKIVDETIKSFGRSANI